MLRLYLSVHGRRLWVDSSQSRNEEAAIRDIRQRHHCVSNSYTAHR